MHTVNVFTLLPGTRPLHSYRSALQRHVAQHATLNLLPALFDLPLSIDPLPAPDAILAAPQSFSLHAPPAGGRTLALLQIAHIWSQATLPTPLIYLSLAEGDSPNLTPRAIITGAFHQANIRAAASATQRPAILLIDDWEELPANRRAVWQTYLTGLAEHWPGARAVVALPAREPAWPSFTALTLAPPDDTLLAVWLGRLLPNHDPAPILAALAAEPLAILRQNLADLLLLALVYPLSGLPTNRADLYAQAYALAQPVLTAPADEPTHHPRRLKLPALTPARALLRHYRLARSLAGGAALAALAQLPPHERAAVAPFTAGLLDDPTPVLDLLWQHANGPDLDALAACLRIDPTAAPHHALRLVEQLCAARALPALHLLTPVLPQLLSSADPDHATQLQHTLAQLLGTPAPQPASTAPALPDPATFATLCQTNPAAACAQLDDLVLRTGAAIDQLVALFPIAASMDDRVALTCFARYVLAESVRLPIRLTALEQLAVRGHQGMAVIHHLVQAKPLPLVLRVRGVRHLGMYGHPHVLTTIRELVLQPNPPLLRRAAAAALSAMIRRPATTTAASAVCVALLRKPELDREVTLAAIHSMASAEPTLALPVLIARLDPRYPAALANAWAHAAPLLRSAPAHTWLSGDLPAAVQCLLADALAAGNTPADPPSSLAELANQQANAEACAAVAALVQVGQREPTLAPNICVRLQRTLTAPERPEIAEAVLHALGLLCPAGGSTALATLLDDPNVPISTRWRAISLLGDTPGGAELALQRIVQGADDPFTTSKLLALLGSQSPPRALGLLCQIIEDETTPLFVRQAALNSVGQFSSDQALSALLRYIAHANPPELRTNAANLLPAGLSHTHCRNLRELLRHERDSACCAAIIAALGRASDHEAIALLIRYTQSEHAAVALAAVEAIAALGDTHVVAPLVRVTQNPHAASHVRLAAVGALIQLCGDEFAPLLRDYLRSPQLGLCLSAHTMLANHYPDDPRLLSPLADPDAPLALRLAILMRISTTQPDEPVIRLLLTNAEEPTQLRINAAITLRASRDPATISALADTIAATDLPILQHHCLNSIASIAGSDSSAAHQALRQLETYATPSSSAAYLQQWATVALLHLPGRG
jgi:uncharacterized protein (UPF0147 family)